MRALTRWHPFADISHTRRLIDRLFDDAFFRPYRFGVWTLDNGYVPLDVYQTKDDAVVKASLPGLKPEDVEISIEDNVLTIKGRVQASEEVENESYVLRERRHGSFHRSVTLPDNLNTDKTEATFKEGILTVSIPKLEESKPRTIKVKADKQTEGKKV
ncbi:MAG: Hsp20/alpha crystallin family protein [Dehalococcoidia bacterium]